MKKDAKQIEKPAENTINLIPRKLKAKEWKDIGNRNLKFNNLLILSFAGYDKYNARLLKCLCDCGKTKILLATKVINERVKSCGCRRKRVGSKNPLFRGFGDIHGKFWSRAKRNARIRNIPFDISMSDAWKVFLKQEKKCAYSGDLLKFASDFSLNDGNASLDRIDSSKGYTKNNIQWTTKHINLMKLDHSHKEFIAIIKKISQYVA